RDRGHLARHHAGRQRREAAPGRPPAVAAQWSEATSAVAPSGAPTAAVLVVRATTASATREAAPAQNKASRTAAALPSSGKNEAKIATPRAVPICRLAFSTPAPMPDSEGGTLARMAAFIDGATKPAPKPISIRAGASIGNGTAGGSMAAHQALAPSIASPARMGTRVP